MSKLNTNPKTDQNTDPTSPNYKQNVRNKANQKTPYGEDEPSINTTYK